MALCFHHELSVFEITAQDYEKATSLFLGNGERMGLLVSFNATFKNIKAKTCPSATALLELIFMDKTSFTSNDVAELKLSLTKFKLPKIYMRIIDYIINNTTGGVFTFERVGCGVTA